MDRAVESLEVGGRFVGDFATQPWIPHCRTLGGLYGATHVMIKLL